MSAKGITMKTLRFPLLVFLSTLLFARSSFGAADPGWLAPLDGETFGVAPANTGGVYFSESGFFVRIEVPRSVPSSLSAVVLDGTTAVGTLYQQLQNTGPRHLTGTLRLLTPGTRTLSVRLSDGFTITTITGPTIHVVTPAPVPVFGLMAATNVTANSATFNADVNLRGIGYKKAVIEFGATIAYGKTLNVGGYLAEGGVVRFSGAYGASPFFYSSVSDVLEPETEYHYRIVVDGLAGPDNVFVTAPNQAPVARDDIIVLDSSGTAQLDCLRNDSDDGLNASQMRGTGWWSLIELSQPAHGQVEFSLDGTTLRYTAGTTFENTDEFFYTVRDRHGSEATGRVLVRNAAAHYSAVAGSYSTAVLDENSKPIGSLDLQLSKTGHFTGVLVYYGKRFSISDRFILFPDYPLALWTDLELPREGQPPLLLGFGIEYDFLDNIPILTAGLTTRDGDFSIPQAPQLVPPSEQVPEAGQFNIAMANPNPVIDDNAPAPEEADIFGVPQGNGFARMRVKRSGSVTVAGRMPDNRPFASGTRIRKDRKAMVNSKVGSDRKGSLYGVMGFSVLAGTGGDGEMTWSNPERQSGLYRSEFSLTMNAKGRSFTPASGRESALYYPVGAPHLVRVIVRNHAGGLITDQTRIIDNRNRIMSDSGETRKLQITLNPATGLFSGKVLERGKPVIPLTGLLQPLLRRGVGISGKTGFEGTVEIIAL